MEYETPIDHTRPVRTAPMKIREYVTRAYPGLRSVKVLDAATGEQVNRCWPGPEESQEDVCAAIMAVVATHPAERFALYAEQRDAAGKLAVTSCEYAPSRSAGPCAAEA